MPLENTLNCNSLLWTFDEFDTFELRFILDVYSAMNKIFWKYLAILDIMKIISFFAIHTSICIEFDNPSVSVIGINPFFLLLVKTHTHLKAMNIVFTCQPSPITAHSSQWQHTIACNFPLFSCSLPWMLSVRPPLHHGY